MIDASSRLIDVDRWERAWMCSSSSYTNSNSSCVRSWDLRKEKKTVTNLRGISSKHRQSLQHIAPGRLSLFHPRIGFILISFCSFPEGWKCSTQTFESRSLHFLYMAQHQPSRTLNTERAKSMWSSERNIMTRYIESVARAAEMVYINHSSDTAGNQLLCGHVRAIINR